MDIITTLQKDKAIWDLFTRKEEYSAQMRDQYGRFPYFASNNRHIFEPCVSRYLVEQGYHPEYPENKPFAVCLTHDIDILYKSRIMKTYEAVGKIRNARTSVDYLAQMRSKKLPFWNFSDIMALEDAYDAKSSFYFLVLNPGDRDYNYDIESCESTIGEISDGGWEVGLHGGHTTYNNPVEMKERKQRLEKVTHKKVTGYRNHYLRFRVPDSFEYLREAGFHYDTTLGYADCIGFRNGMCHPFKPYNLTTRREIDILEIPLHLMDDSLDRYMKLDAGTSWEMTKQLIDTAERYHGVLTILWHNYSFFGEQRKFYEKILHYCRDKNSWMTSGEELSAWWKDNAKDERP